VQVDRLEVTEQIIAAFQSGEPGSDALAKRLALTAVALFGFQGVERQRRGWWG